MFNNLLNQALTTIPSQEFVYYRRKDSTINELGIRQITYEEPQTLRGSVQSIEQRMYEELGLDRSRKYIKICVSANIRSVDNEQDSPDKIIWMNKIYLVIKCTTWFAQDGWVRIIAVEQEEQ